jgi:hypothetical protein
MSSDIFLFQDYIASLLDSFAKRSSDLVSSISKSCCHNQNEYSTCLRASATTHKGVTRRCGDADLQYLLLEAQALTMHRVIESTAIKEEIAVSSDSCQGT